MIDDCFQLRMLRSLAYNRDMSGIATAKQVRLLNIFLSYYCEERSLRLWLLEQWFQRPFSTSKELKKTEACALLDLMYTENTWEHDQDFVDFLKDCIRFYYQF